MIAWPRAWRWAPVVLIAGCSTAAIPVAQVCSIRKAAEILITNERGFVSVAAVIDGKPVTMLIDSGSETSLVTPSAITALHLATDPHRRTIINGSGGTITTQNARVQTLELGGMQVMDQSAAVGPLPVAQGAALAASGLLGADWLSDFDVEFDLPRGRMALYRVQGCNGDYVPWQGAKTSVTAQLYGRGLLIVPVRFDGQKVTAIVDSGASRSVLGEQAAARIGVDAAALARDRSGESTGVDGTKLASHQHRFADMQIGAARYAAPALAIAPLRLTFADMLLGADWLRGNRVWLAYGARRVTVQPESVSR